MESKHDFRKILLDLRKAQYAQAGKKEDAQITANFIATPQYKNATCILTYLSFGEEIDTWEIIKHAQANRKTIVAPRCVKNSHEMQWYELPPLNFAEVSSPEKASTSNQNPQLEKSTFGMLEPCTKTCPKLDSSAYNTPGTIAIVPGLTFDKLGYRLGYGGGFYDTFLKKFTGTSIGLCRSTFLQNDLRERGIIEPHDLPVDIVITPTTIIYAK